MAAGQCQGRQFDQRRGVTRLGAQQREIGGFCLSVPAPCRQPAGQGQGAGYAWTSSSAFGLAAWLGGVAGLVTVTEITSPLGDVTVVVTAPSGAVETLVLSAALAAEEAEAALPAELRRLNADAALLATGLRVINGLLKSVGSKNTDWLTSACFAAGQRGATQARLR
jgi:hypothetical protein